jgi:hypothetical protein
MIKNHPNSVGTFEDRILVYHLFAVGLEGATNNSCYCLTLTNSYKARNSVMSLPWQGQALRRQASRTI